MNNTKHRSPFAIAARLIVLVRPMLPIMLAAIVMGVIGHFCATFITIFARNSCSAAGPPGNWGICSATVKISSTSSLGFS